MGVRFPERAAWWSYGLPSLDVLALLVVLSLCGAWKKRVPSLVHGVMVAFCVATRVLRVADGVERGAYLRDFRLTLDLPLLPEFVRLFYMTLPPAKLLLAGSALTLGLAALSFSIHCALRIVETAMGSFARVQLLSVLIGSWALPSALFSPEVLYHGSILPRLGNELEFALRLGSYRARQRESIASVQRAFDAQPNDLQKLHGRNVYLFMIESYGQSVQDSPEILARLRPEYRRFERELSEEGFHIASRLLDSSTYGGRSWLAHATLFTSVATGDLLQLDLLRAAQPRTWPEVFSSAGYRSVLVQPGTVRESREPDLYHFDQHYFARDLAYRGPRFGWATMPDQFVLAAVRQRELATLPARPLFLAYALVSSHVPWSELPPVIDDWSTLGDGSIYRELPSKHYATEWLSLSEAKGAYADSIAYDLEVLRRYIRAFVDDDSLLIILGDHQPHSEVGGQNPSAGVPVHVLCRNSAFIAPFRARGYTPGMLADQALPHPGLASLLFDLVSDFSVARAGGAP
jgi:hypothetical protein